MSVILILLTASLTIAIGFLAAFVWSVKNGQYDDDYTPSIRMLFDNDMNPAAEIIHEEKIKPASAYKINSRYTGPGMLTTELDGELKKTTNPKNNK